MAGAEDIKNLTFTPEQPQMFAGLVAGRRADIVADLRAQHNTMGNQCGRECEFIEGWYEAENAIRKAYGLPQTALPEIVNEASKDTKVHADFDQARAALRSKMQPRLVHLIAGLRQHQVEEAVDMLLDYIDANDDAVMGG